MTELKDIIESLFYEIAKSCDNAEEQAAQEEPTESSNAMILNA